MTTAHDVGARHGDPLNGLIGRRLGTTWSLCFVGDGGWCSTRPLVLDFEGRHLENAVNGFDRLYVTWDEIDIDEPLAGEGQDDPDTAVTWRNSICPYSVR